VSNKDGVGDDALDRWRHMTFDQLVTWTKSHGACLQLNAFTTPEGWPVSALVAVGKPGNEAIIDIVVLAANAMRSAPREDMRKAMREDMKKSLRKLLEKWEREDQT
jgi:hypothetical protein